MPLKKSERRTQLIHYLVKNPLATDEQLAETFAVSVATIRLDRAALHIPETRERMRQMATSSQDTVRTIHEEEIIGQIVELKLNAYGVSLFHVLPQHVFLRSEVVRGHYLFAHVNSLAVALMDATTAVTAKTELRFYRPVILGETLLARADVVASKSGVVKCYVETKSREDMVLDGFIWVSKDPSYFSRQTTEEILE